MDEIDRMKDLVSFVGAAELLSVKILILISHFLPASIQRTNHVPLIDFAIEIHVMHLQPLRYGQPPISRQRTENMPPKDK